MNTNFVVFGLTRPGIEPESTASVADALSTPPLIGNILVIGNGFSVLLFAPAAPKVFVEIKRTIYTAFCPSFSDSSFAKCH